MSSILRAAGATVLAALSLRLTRFEIAEESMTPALMPGDWVLAVKRPRGIRVGDVVVFEMQPGFEVVKRVAEPPPGSAGLWLLGDHPGAGSVDSRSLGAIPRDRVIARLILRYHPRPLAAVGRP
ncbi:MAG: S26 family signal peptidase [Acidimicrobiia bacterium]